MTKLYARRTELSAQDIINMSWKDVYTIERKIQEDLDQDFR